MKEKWNYGLTLMLGLSGLQRAGNNSFNLSFSDLGLKTASDFEVKKTNKQKVNNKKVQNNLSPAFL